MFSTVGVMNRRNVEAWSTARDIACIVGPGGTMLWAAAEEEEEEEQRPSSRPYAIEDHVISPFLDGKVSLSPRLWWCRGLVLLLLLYRMTNLQKYHPLGHSLRRHRRLHSLRQHLPRHRLYLHLGLLLGRLLHLLVCLLLGLLFCLLLGLLVHLLVRPLLGLALSRPLWVQRMVAGRIAVGEPVLWWNASDAISWHGQGGWHTENGLPASLWVV